MYLTPDGRGQWEAKTGAADRRRGWEQSTQARRGALLGGEESETMRIHDESGGSYKANFYIGRS